MKYTSLFSAVAVAVAMSTQAFATVTTNHTQTVDFEGAETLPGNLTGWTAQTGDLSSIIEAPLSESSAREGGYARKHLELNTEGLELKWTPANMSTNKAIIEMKVRLVASDTAPTISDDDVHAAVYLKVDENAPTDDGLYAYTATGWQKLDTSGFNADLATGSMVALRVVMDYAARQATYEGALLADAETDVPVYVTLGTKDMANANHAQTQGKLASISFKGTGGVDDLFVGEIEEAVSEATIAVELWTDSTAVEPEEPRVSKKIDTVAQGSTVSASFETDLTGETLTWKLYDITSGEPGTECQWTTVPTDDGEGNYLITMANYTFLVDHSYLVMVLTYTESSEPEYQGPTSGNLQILCATDADAYEDATGDTWAAPEFKSIKFVGQNVVLTFDAVILVADNQEPATASFGVMATTALDGSGEDKVLTGTVAENDTEEDGDWKVVIPAPIDDALFIQGFTDVPANN